MGFVSDIIGGITGSSQADAAEDAAQIQAAAGDRQLQELIRGKEEGLGFLEPFGPVGQAGLDNLSILTDPRAQFQYLQNNPLFKFALENANRNTMQTAAAGGRLSAGDTLQQLTNNSFLSAQPLLANQQQNVFGLLGQGQNLGTAQANTAIGVGSQMGDVQAGIGNALAAGQIGSANATTQGAGNLLGLGLTGLMLGGVI